MKWFKTDGPLEDGFYWQRLPGDIELFVVLVESGVCHYHGQLGEYTDWEEYEWCGPLEPPGKD